jgi:hypothetical protein
VFRLEVRKPPPGARQEYRTVDERCMACEVMGGSERNCQSKPDQRKLLARTGRPCPRVELEPANLAAWEMVTLGLNETVRPLLPLHLEAVAEEEGLDASEQRDLINRVRHALSDQAVTAILYPEPKRTTPPSGKEHRG